MNLGSDCVMGKHFSLLLMERYTKERVENGFRRNRGARNSNNGELERKMAELAKTKEEIKKARESAIQSWLDSEPVIDQLEKQKLELQTARNRASMVATMIDELETQFETTSKNFRSKKREEHMARITIDELGKLLEQTSEMETVKFDTEKGRRARAKMKQELRLRRQTLRRLQLTLRAIRIESEAIGASAADALQYIKWSNAGEYDSVQITHEEYHALVRRAHEETTLAEWRVCTSMEQKDAAELSKETALEKLTEVNMRKRLRKKCMNDGKIAERREQELTYVADEGDPRRKKITQEEKVMQETYVAEDDDPRRKRITPEQVTQEMHVAENGDTRIRRKTKKQVMHKRFVAGDGDPRMTTHTNRNEIRAPVKANKALAVDRRPSEQLRKSNGSYRKKIIKKKPSILHKIKSYLVRIISKFFR